MLQFGFNQPFAVFCNEILEAGSIRWHEWIFPFRYDGFVANLASLPDVEVIVRSYDHPEKGSPILDFFSTVGISEPWVSSTALPRENQRRHLGEIVRRYWTNRTRHALHADDVETITAFFDDYKGARPTMSLSRQAEFAEAFDNSNLRLFEQYRLPAFPSMRQDGHSATAGLSMDDIFAHDIRATLPFVASAARYSTK